MNHTVRIEMTKLSNELLAIGRAISEGAAENSEFDTGVTLQLMSRALLNMEAATRVGDKAQREEAREAAVAFLKNASDLLKK